MTTKKTASELYDECREDIPPTLAETPRRRAPARHGLRVRDGWPAWGQPRQDTSQQLARRHATRDQNQGAGQPIREG